MKIFWSWQSDRPAKLCKELVKSVLNDIAEEIADELDLEEADRPDVDHDTRKAVGWVDIVATILAKIEATAVFVCDVTPIGKADSGRTVQNPNVLIELGYAMRALDHSQIVLIANTAWGYTPENLPFDIRQKRGPITYKLPAKATDDELASARAQLKAELRPALAEILGTLIATKDRDTNLVGYPSREGDPSTWLKAGEKMDYRGVGGGREGVSVAEGTRSYIRIMPAGWRDGIPNRSTIEELRDNMAVRPIGRWSSGTFGPNSLGFVSLGLPPRDEPITTATQWFSATGEIWGFDMGMADRSGLATHLVFRGWYSFLRNSIRRYWRSTQ